MKRNELEKRKSGRNDIMQSVRQYGMAQNLGRFRERGILKFTQCIPSLMTDIPEQTKLIVLIDIVGFSKSTSREQVTKIYTFQNYLFSQVITGRRLFCRRIKINQFIPTGDGCYIVADKCDAEFAMQFLVTLLSELRMTSDNRNEMLALRISALFGCCIPFVDMAKHFNYIGTGMNEAMRILTVGQEMLEAEYAKSNPSSSQSDIKLFSRNSLFLGDTLAGASDQFCNQCASVYTFCDAPDKHGMTRNITVLQGINTR